MRKLKMVRSWTFPSRSSPGTSYTTMLWSDGSLSCDCRGWCVKKEGKERECTHTRGVRLDLNMDAEVRIPAVDLTIRREKGEYKITVESTPPLVRKTKRKIDLED